MLFTLTTLKSLASGVCCSEEQNVGTESLFFAQEWRSVSRWWWQTAHKN